MAKKSTKPFAVKDSLPTPAVFGIIGLAVLMILGYGWHSMNDNGESRNPNVGKPTKGKVLTHLSRKAGDNMTEDTYMKFLKQNRPDLSDTEIKAKADNWWRIRSGQ